MSGKNRWAGITALLAGVACLFYLRARNDEVPETQALRVLIITMDTTRFDHLGVSGCRAAGESPTPSLDQLAVEGRSYPFAFAPVPLTLPSHATILTGLSPREHGLRENDAFVLPPRSARSFSTISETLNDRGFDCAAVVSARPLDAVYGLAQGFHRYHDVSASPVGGALSLPERDAEETTDLAIAEVKRQTSSPSSVLWVHYFDPHHPHKKHGGLAGRVGEAMSDYAGEIAYMDEQIGRLLSSVEEQWDLSKTLIFAVGDHGEGLSEHGEETHGHLIHDATIRVPFIVRPPKGVSLVSRDQLVSLADVAVTIDALTGGLPTGGLLASENQRKLVYAECVRPYRQFGWAAPFSIRDTNLKLTVGGGRARLFDWRVDPGELNDLSAERPTDVDRLKKELVDYRRNHRSMLTRDARLRGPSAIGASGYMGGPSADVPAEPDVDENRTLPAPQDQMHVISLLDQLRLELERGQLVATESVARVHLESARQHAVRLAEVSPDCPVSLFWQGRAWLQLQSSRLGFSPSIRGQLLRRAAASFERHLTMRPLDHRTHNMLLKVSLQLYSVSQDRAELGLLLNRAEAQRRAGLADPLTCALEGLAHEANGSLEKAVERLREAVRGAPENQAFRRDLTRLEAAGGLRK